MKNFTEWLSDNLRYILLGVAGILLIIIAFFAIKLVMSIGSSPKKQAVAEEQMNDDSDEDTIDDTIEAQTEAKTSRNLTKDDPDILAFITRYYNARASKDFDTLKLLCEKFDDTIRQEIESQDSAIESYSNIMTYSKSGLTEGSFVVYVYFDAKLTGITTPAPSLRELYLITDADNEIVISDDDKSTEQKNYIEQMRADGDVQALINDVNKKLKDAEAADEDLKNFIESDIIPDSTETGGVENNDTQTTSGAMTGPMMANTSVNVRGEPSADSTLYGSLFEGMQVEVLENLDSGWSKIQYITDGTTIIGYVMTQYLSSY